MYQFTLATAIIFALVLSISSLAFAQKHKVNIKGGPLKEKDWLAEAPGAELGEDHSNVKTFELDVANQDNMNRDGPADNIDTYVMCVIKAPKDMKSIFSPAHDDWAQIWVNGDKWYNDRTWTGGAQIVHYNIEVQLTKGANVVLYRCGESGGAAYLNLHFDKDTHRLCDIYPQKSKDQKSFFNEVRGVLPVDPGSVSGTVPRATMKTMDPSKFPRKETLSMKVPRVN
jgi:hypothetical protein